MAFSDIEKTKIVRFLKWPVSVIDITKVQYSNWVNQRLELLLPPVEVVVRELLERLEKMDERLEKASCRLGVEQIDGVRFNKDEIRMLREERYRLIKELSEALQIPICGASGFLSI